MKPGYDQKRLWEMNIFINKKFINEKNKNKH